MAGHPVLPSERMEVDVPTAEQYRAMADVLVRLPTLLRERRADLRMPLRVVAAQMGVDHGALHRLEVGRTVNPKEETVLVVLEWLARHAGHENGGPVRGSKSGLTHRMSKAQPSYLHDRA